MEHKPKQKGGIDKRWRRKRTERHNWVRLKTEEFRSRNSKNLFNCENSGENIFNKVKYKGAIAGDSKSLQKVTKSKQQDKIIRLFYKW